MTYNVFGGTLSLTQSINDCFVCVELSRSAVPCRECGSICSTNYDSHEQGQFYPLLRKTVNCDNIMHRMAFCPFKVVRPPPRHPPRNLIEDFTMNGQCRLGRPWYFDDSAPSVAKNFTAERFRSLLQRDNQGININHYHDRNTLRPALRRYIDSIRDKHVAVIGTAVPWAEAMLINLGADRITTVEYRNIVIEHPRLQVITPYKLAEKFLNRTADTFDTAFSYSSIEHAGLGRYGDPLMPYGDMEALAQIWCVTKPGGYLFLALPMTRNRKECVLIWNANRNYGSVRMQHLTANWKVLDEINLRDKFNAFLYVLQKLE